MQGSARVGRGLKIRSLMRQLRHHNLAPTPSVIINVKRFSLTFRKLSASVSVRKEFSIAVVRATATPSHSSSTSREDRNEPVVSSTWDSTMKKPEISWVRVGRDASGRGIGRIRPDWACYTVTVGTCCSYRSYNHRTFLSAWYDFWSSLRESRALYMWMHSNRGLKSTCSLSLSRTSTFENL